MAATITPIESHIKPSAGQRPTRDRADRAPVHAGTENSALLAHDFAVAVAKCVVATNDKGAMSVRQKDRMEHAMTTAVANCGRAQCPHD
jgi:hypothetical protein